MTSILIVDDAAFTRRMLRKYLQTDGYEILEASNGREGLEVVRNQTPDCVLTDVLMPDLNGFEFIEALNSEGFKVPTIIITADIQDASRDRGLELGAAAFINKPIKESEVRETVKQVCSNLMEQPN